MSLLRTFSGLCLVLLCAFSPATSGQQPARRHVAPGKLPIVFEAIPGPGSWLGRVDGRTIVFDKGGLHVTSAQNSSPLTLSFANTQRLSPVGEGLLAGQTHYLLGNDPTRWRTHVSNYARVAYHALYPGIDAVFYGNGQDLEHDFLVAPGSDPRQIRFTLPANAHARLQPVGDLAITSPDGTWQLRKPVVYQGEGPQRHQLAGSYQLFPDRTVGFHLGAYNPYKTLVIDPVLTFGTYLSTGSGEADAVATDASGATYITGTTALGYPVTSGAYPGCATCTATSAVTFISKLSPDGKTLLYSTLFGGNNFAQPTGIAVDRAGDAVVSISTAATDLPQKNSLPVFTPADFERAYLVSLSPDGSSLNFATTFELNSSQYFSSNSTIAGVAVDGSDNIYVAGNTGPDFLVTPGALNNSTSDEVNANNVFLIKLKSSGDLLYSAVLGPGNTPGAYPNSSSVQALAVDPAGNAFVSGVTGVPWPTTPGVYLSQNPTPGSAVGFVSKVAPDGASLLYSTYLNAAGRFASLAVSPQGSVFVGVQGADATYPTTPDAYLPNTAGGSAVTELDAAGAHVLYSSLVTSFPNGLNALTLDGADNLWLALETKDPEFPLKHPVQATFASVEPGEDLMSAVQEFDPTGKTLLFSTFLGGAADGFASDIAVDPAGRAHVSGGAGYGFSTTPGAYIGSLPSSEAGSFGNISPYTAVLDPTVAAPSVCIQPNTILYVGQVTSGTTFDMAYTITNCGNAPLTVSSATASPAPFSLPADKNTCSQTVPVDGTCSVTIRYAPVGFQDDKGTFTLISNASIPTTLPITGTGIKGPIPGLAPASLNFAAQVIGTTSAAQTLTLSNTGSSPLDGFTLSIAGANAASFAETDNCGAELATNSSCTISITFKPTAAGAASASLQFTAYPRAQAGPIPLTGTAPATAFTLSSAAPTQTVAAGQAASYALSLSAANGYNGTLAFKCLGLPANATCAFNPASLALAGGNTASVTVAIATQPVQTAASGLHKGAGALVAGLLLGLPWLRRRRPPLLAFALLLLLGGLLTGETGCSSSGPAPVPKVAPGSYPLQVQAADSTTTVTQSLTLVVQ